MARLILDTPPPLTPAGLRNFPYRARPFPFDTLLNSARLTARASAQDQPVPPATPPRVE